MSGVQATRGRLPFAFAAASPDAAGDCATASALPESQELPDRRRLADFGVARPRIVCCIGTKSFRASPMRPERLAALNSCSRSCHATSSQWPQSAGYRAGRPGFAGRLRFRLRLWRTLSRKVPAASTTGHCQIGLLLMALLRRHVEELTCRRVEPLISDAAFPSASVFGDGSAEAWRIRRRRAGRSERTDRNPDAADGRRLVRSCCSRRMPHSKRRRADILAALRSTSSLPPEAFQLQWTHSMDQHQIGCPAVFPRQPARYGRVSMMAKSNPSRAAPG